MSRNERWTASTPSAVTIYRILTDDAQGGVSPAAGPARSGCRSIASTRT
ncbi:hypothetical protein [Streptomyces lydicus]